MHHGQGSGILWTGEWKAMAEGNWQTCRRGKVPLLGWRREGGADCHRKILAPKCSQVTAGLQRVGQYQRRLPMDRSHLLPMVGWTSLAQAAGGQRILASLRQTRGL